MTKKVSVLLVIAFLVGATGCSSSSDSGATVVCDMSHLSLCTTESTCSNASGYWYDNSCNSDPSSTWGVKKNVDQSDLEAEGWSICFSESYDVSGVSAISSILSSCNKSRLMLACRHVGNPIFVLSAEASRADVTYDTGTDHYTTHTANGVEWYFNDNQSWGFAPEGDSVFKNECDLSDTDPDYRMCINTMSGNLIYGYRCGDNNLNSDASWERVFLER